MSNCVPSSAGSEGGTGEQGDAATASQTVSSTSLPTNGNAGAAVVNEPPPQHDESREKEVHLGGLPGTTSPEAPPEPSNERDESENATHFLRMLQESMTQRERFLQLEFKAKKSYECALNISKPPKGLDEKLRTEIAKALNEAQMAELTRQLNLDPPEIAMVPYLLQLAHHSFVDALPTRHQERVMEEFRASMGFNKNPNGPDISVGRIAFHMHTVITKVIEYGAPTRAEALRNALRERCGAIEKCEPSLGEAVSEGFRFLFAAIQQLHQDVSQYTLLMVSEELKTNAVTYIRNFISACLPPPQAWRSSIDFLKKYMRSPEVLGWVSNPTTPNPTALTPTQLRVQGALLFGALDLLRSGQRNGQNRWADLPGELFYFDKTIIFEAANAVQESTLLILLEGAVSSIFKDKGGSSMSTTRMLHSLHSKILSLFSEDIRLDDLKREVVHFIHTLFAESGNEDKILSEQEETMVTSVIEKMADTEGPLYISFERKVLTFVSRKMKRETDVPPLGLVTNSLTLTTSLLSQGLAFNWEVYLPYYMELIPTLLLDDDDAPASQTAS